MTPFKKIFETDDRYERCDSCEEGVLASEAFKENGEYYHADCAGVWRCGNCGVWNEKARETCQGCGEKKNEDRPDNR